MARFLVGTGFHTCRQLPPGWPLYDNTIEGAIVRVTFPASNQTFRDREGRRIADQAAFRTLVAVAAGSDECRQHH